MIELDRFRLTSVTCDMGSTPTVWIVHGYFITKGMGKIFANFTYSSDEAVELMGGQHFVPSQAMQDLTGLLLKEAHEVIERRIWDDFAKVKEVKDNNSGSGQLNN